MIFSSIPSMFFEEPVDTADNTGPQAVYQPFKDYALQAYQEDTEKDFQKRLLEDFACKSGMTNIKHFTDDGYTGRNFNRPGFQAMLAEVEAGKIGTVIVKDMSRFGRNDLEVGFYTEILFPKKQIRFIAINNNVDSDNPQDNSFTPFLNISISTKVDGNILTGRNYNTIAGEIT